MTGDPERGHLFVIDGDLTRLACDAMLIPVDRPLNVTESWAALLDTGAGPLNHRPFPDGVRAMRWEGSDRLGRPAIWLGDIGRTRAPKGWYADGLVEFVERASREVRSARPGRPATLAVPVVGTGRGGSSGDKGTIFRTIVPRLREAAAANDVDVVLVCFGAQSYSAAQRARFNDHVDNADRTGMGGTITRLATAAQRSELALFIGAGVSMGAGLPSWRALIAQLLGQIDESDRPTDLDDLDVRDQAELIRHGFDKQHLDLSEVVREVIRPYERYSLTHGLLAGLRTRENITTNYDRLFEEAVTTAGRSVAIMPNTSADTADDRWLLKLHGTVDGDGPIVLTRSDYLALPTRAGALFGLLQAQLLTRHLLFVGYSLTDDSFHQVVHEVRAAVGDQQGRPLGTALVLFRDERLEQLWGDILHIVPMVDRRPIRPTDEELNRASRVLDLVLDEVARRSADVTAFLLDRDYRQMLNPVEQAIADHLAAIPDLADAARSPVVERVTTWLHGLGRA